MAPLKREPVTPTKRVSFLPATEEESRGRVSFQPDAEEEEIRGRVSFQPAGEDESRGRVSFPPSEEETRGRVSFQEEGAHVHSEDIARGRVSFMDEGEEWMVEERGDDGRQSREISQDPNVRDSLYIWLDMFYAFTTGFTPTATYIVVHIKDLMVQLQTFTPSDYLLKKKLLW